jgi:DNA-binding CsgD family transcriptional regulator
MDEHGSTAQQTEGRLSTIDSAVGQLIRRLIENDDRFDPTTEPERIILDVEVDGIRYLAIRCCPRPATASDPPPDRTPPGPSPSLSPREAEIARMVAKGYPNKTIASVLDISSWTVSSHLRRIFSKYGVTSRAAMVARLLNDRRGGEAPTLRWPNRQPISPAPTRSPSAYRRNADRPDAGNPSHDTSAEILAR